MSTGNKTPLHSGRTGYCSHIGIYNSFEAGHSAVRNTRGSSLGSPNATQKRGLKRPMHKTCRCAKSTTHHIESRNLSLN